MTTDGMNGASATPEDSIDLQAARCAVHDRARLRKILNDPHKGPAARFAYDFLQPYWKYILSEQKRGTSPHEIANALGQFFGQAVFMVARMTGDPPQVCRIAMDTAANKLTDCFRAGSGAGLIVPARHPNLVLAKEIIDPKKVKA